MPCKMILDYDQNKIDIQENKWYVQANCYKKINKMILICPISTNVSKQRV